MMSRSASGARQAGDAFQHLIAWNRALQALHGTSTFIEIGLEDPDAGNVDDVTITYADDSGEYCQVKYSVDASTPINIDYLLAIATKNGTSILQKLLRTWQTLIDGGAIPRLHLITNKVADHTDPTIKKLDSRTRRLDGILANQPTALDRLSRHLGVDEITTLRLFEHLDIHVGTSFGDQMELAAARMDGRGMRSDEPAIRQGIDLMREYVLAGTRRIDSSTLLADIDALNLSVRAPTQALSIQAIDWDPTAEEAEETLDWVDLYDGDTPRARRRPLDPNSYRTVMQPQLDAAAARLLATAPPSVRLRGFMRLPAWFAAGAALPRTRHVELEMRQRGAVWRTDATRDRDSAATLNWAEGPHDGGEVAVILAITNDPTADVLAYLAGSDLPVESVAVITIAGGAGDTSIDDDGHAVAVARDIVELTRQAVRESSATRTHLFAAAPGGLMAILGHRWNRTGPTTVYEDLGAPGYLPAFHIDG